MIRAPRSFGLTLHFRTDQINLLVVRLDDTEEPYPIALALVKVVVREEDLVIAAVFASDLKAYRFNERRSSYDARVFDVCRIADTRASEWEGGGGPF